MRDVNNILKPGGQMEIQWPEENWKLGICSLEVQEMV